jgi:hypothetical protein
MAVAVGVGVSVGAGVNVALGTSVAVTAGETGEWVASAHPARKNSVIKRTSICRKVPWLLFGRKDINTVDRIFIHNLQGIANRRGIILHRHHMGHSVKSDDIVDDFT